MEGYFPVYVYLRNYYVHAHFVHKLSQKLFIHYQAYPPPPTPPSFTVDDHEKIHCARRRPVGMFATNQLIGWLGKPLYCVT